MPRARIRLRVAVGMAVWVLVLICPVRPGEAGQRKPRRTYGQMIIPQTHHAPRTPYGTSIQTWPKSCSGRQFGGALGHTVSTAMKLVSCQF